MKKLKQTMKTNNLTSQCLSLYLMKKILLGISLCLVLLGLTACQKKAAPLLETPIKREATSMGTFVQLTVYDKGKEKAADVAMKIPEQFSKEVSTQIKAINAGAGAKSVKVSPAVYQLVKLGYDYSAKNLGYDITIGALTNLWRIGYPDARKPSNAEIKAVLPLVNYKFLQFNDSEQSIKLSQKGAQLDVGSIVKGVVAVKMRESLEKAGVTTGIINLGSSSIFVMGHSPRGADEPWKVAIKDPNQSSSQLGILQASNQAINSSGIYERYLEVGGQKYAHLLDPKTGFPFDNDLASVTLLISGNDPSNGDGLSTLIYALGTKKGFQYVESLKNVQAVFVDKNGQVYLTPGLKDKFKLTDNEHYKLGNIEDLTD